MLGTKDVTEDLLTVHKNFFYLTHPSDAYFLLAAVLTEILFLIYMRWAQIADSDQFYRDMFRKHLYFGLFYFVLAGVVSWSHSLETLTAIPNSIVGFLAYLIFHYAWITVPITITKKSITLNFVNSISQSGGAMDRTEFEDRFGSSSTFESVKNDRFGQLLATKGVRVVGPNAYQISPWGRRMIQVYLLICTLYGIKQKGP